MIRKKHNINLIALVIAILTFSSCTLIPEQDMVYQMIPAHKLKSQYTNKGAYYKIGNPYELYGKHYYPRINNKYNTEGVASWYGPNFQGGKTANGEKFNQYDLTAAHNTLPIPSIVEVTSLENGRKVKVRINDRGPFKDNRIIDLSKAAAVELGMINQGTAKVRVKYLVQDTDKLHLMLFDSLKNR